MYIFICRNQFESASSCSLYLVLQKQGGLKTSGNEVLSNGFVYRGVQEDKTSQNFGQVNYIPFADKFEKVFRNLHQP